MNTSERLPSNVTRPHGGASSHRMKIYERKTPAGCSQYRQDQQDHFKIVVIFEPS
jgi:hypothetical protein